MERFYPSLLFFVFLCQIIVAGSSPKKSLSIIDLDWDKFDHLYVIDPLVHTHSEIPSTPPPELSKETQLAISALDLKQQQQKQPQTLTYSQKHYQKAKEREQEKLKNMSKEEREKYFQQKKIKQGELRQKRKETMGYRSYTAKRYDTLKKLVNTNEAKPDQVAQFEELKNNNRIKRQKWRHDQKEQFKVIRTYNKNDNLTAEQRAQLQRYEKHKEKTRLSSQRARDRRKQTRLQSKDVRKD